MRNLRSLRPVAVAGVVALALLATACSGDDDNGGNAASGAPTISAQEAMARVGQQLDGMKSWSFTIDMESSGSAAVNLKGAGEYQREPSLAMHVKFDNLEGAGQSYSGAELLLVDNQAYLHLGELTSVLGGKFWVTLAGDALGLGDLLDQFAQIDPSTQMKAFIGSSNVTSAGTEEIDGVETTKYTAQLDAADVSTLSGLDPSEREALKKSYDELGIEKINYTVWVDDNYQPRKLVAVTPSAAGDVTVTMNIADINKPVDLSAPPADQVADLPGSS